MQFDRSILAVQRRVVTVREAERELFELIEPLFMIDTHMSFEERLQLFRLAWSLGEGFVACEIGSYVGASTAFLAAAASRKLGRVHAVDTWQNDAMGCEPAVDTFGRFEANLRPWSAWVTPHRGRAEALAEEIPPLDMLFVDGDHTYEATRDHLTGYAAKIRPGGLLVLHDIQYEGVQRAAREIVRPGWVDVGAVDTLQAFRVAPSAAV